MDWQAIAVGALGIIGSAVSGGALTSYFHARKAEAETETAEAENEPGRSAEFNRQILLLFTRIASLENKLETKDAQIDLLQEQVRQLQSERDQLVVEVARLRTQVEGGQHG